MKNKNKALTLISIQHELTMNIGLSLDIVSMTKQFAASVIKRLDSHAVHFIYFSTDKKTLKLDQDQALEYSFPIQKPSVLKANKKLLTPLNIWLSTTTLQTQWNIFSIGDTNFHTFIMPETGLLLLENKNTPLSHLTMSSLQEVIPQLTIASQACFQRTNLTEEIKQRSQIQKELEEEKSRIQTTLHSIGDAVITTDDNDLITYMNPVAIKMTGWNDEVANGENLFSVLGLSLEKHSNEKVIINSTHELMSALKNHSASFILHNKNQKQSVVKISTSPICMNKVTSLGHVVTLHDITHTYKIEQELRWQAWHDPLTQLPNRRNLESNLKKAIYTAQHKNASHILLYIDLDRFKTINDTCGHIAGDFLLKDIAYVMKGQIRHRDLLVRIGGDEFALLLHDTDLTEAILVANRIRNKVTSYRFEWNKKIFSVGASIGAVNITGESINADTVITHADIACYAAKEGGRNRVHIYHESDNEIMQRKREMEWAGRITHAIAEDSFELYCQAVAHLNNNEEPLYHFEILLRMNESNEVINPGAFLPAAERHGLIHEVDSWVITQVLDILEDHAIPEHIDAKHTIININLSGVSMGDKEILNYLVRRLESTPRLAALLCFEITETAAIASLESCLQFMNALTELGCKFALDDFGNGFSSFSYLKNLPVHYLKIDGSFIQNMVHDTVDKTLVDSIYRTAEALNIETIAEFIENEETYLLLKKMGLKLGQGYYFDKPKPFKAMLLKNFPMQLTHIA